MLAGGQKTVERDKYGRNIDKRRAAQRRQYAANSAHILARQQVRLADPEVRERKKASQKAWYLANRERLLTEARDRSRARYADDPQATVQRNTARKHILRAFIRQQKEGKQCIQCGFADPRALDFHHRDGTLKEFNLSSAWQKGWSIKRIAQEIAKCDVLCANCHRIVHASVQDDL